MRVAALTFAISALLGGCATPPVNTASSAPCGFLRFEQAGKAVAAESGAVTLGRAPFSITYTGPGNEPGLNVSAKPTLATALAQAHRPEVWLPLGQGMAGEPGQIATDDKVEMFRDQGPQKAAARVVHPRYWPMVRERVDAAPSVDLAVRVGLNTWWDPGRGGGPRVYTVRTIDGTPVERSRIPALHIVAFGETERIVAQRVNIPMLARARWNACTVRFRP